LFDLLLIDIGIPEDGRLLDSGGGTIEGTTDESSGEARARYAFRTDAFDMEDGRCVVVPIALDADRQ